MKRTLEPVCSQHTPGPPLAEREIVHVVRHAPQQLTKPVRALPDFLSFIEPELETGPVLKKVKVPEVLSELSNSFKQLVFKPPPQKETTTRCERSGVHFLGQNTLRQYQLAILEWMNPRPGGLVCARMGLGKTLIGETFCIQHGPGCLVVVPGPLVDQWLQDAKKMFGNTISIALFSNQTAEELRALQITLVTYDALVSKTATVLFSVSWNAILADECQRFCNPNTRISKLMNKLKGQRKFGLSGTPIKNELKDLRSLLEWCLGKPAVIEMDSFSDHVYALEYSNAGMSLPDMEEVDIELDMPARTRALYDLVKKSSMPEICKGTVLRQLGVAPILAKKTLVKYCKELAQEAWLSDMAGEAGTGSPKMQALQREMLDSVEQKDQLLVICSFAQALKLAQNLVPQEVKVCVLCSETTDTARKEAIRAFKKGRIQILMMTFTLGAEGHNFQNCRRAVMIDRWWTDSSGQQAEGRIWRLGQLRNVSCKWLVMRNSSDQHVLEIVQDKHMQLEEVLAQSQKQNNSNQ